MIILAIKIQTKDSYIPIFLGDLEIRFDISDDSLTRLRKGAARVQEELDAIKEPEDEEKATEEMKGVLKRGFDFLYGEGTFEKVYEITPSVIVCLEYFQQMTEATFKELEKRGVSPSQKEKAKQYLAKKNKKK